MAPVPAYRGGQCHGVPLFFYPLALLALRWLCMLLPLAWSSRAAACHPRPGEATCGPTALPVAALGAVPLYVMPRLFARASRHAWPRPVLVARTPRARPRRCGGWRGQAGHGAGGGGHSQHRADVVARSVRAPPALSPFLSRRRARPATTTAADGMPGVPLLLCAACERVPAPGGVWADARPWLGHAWRPWTPAMRAGRTDHLWRLRAV
jgi:hypothetical protein